VLPDVVRDDRLIAIHIGAVLVRKRDDLELALLVDDEPGESTTEALHAGLFELGLELVVAAEGLGDRLGECADRGATFALAHDLPEEGMIGVSATVVTDGGADCLGNCREIRDQFIHRLGSKLGMILECGVEVVDVSSVVLVVMDLHRARIDVRLEGVKSVGKRRQSVGHRP
jgi:hypothetical protein